VAFVHPHLFGNVWLQSGAFWGGSERSKGAPHEWLASQVQAAWWKTRLADGIVLFSAGWASR